MLSWLKQIWTYYRDSQEVSKQTKPEALLGLSREVRALAAAVNRFCVNEPQLRTRLKKVEQEMQMLEEIIGRPNFRLVTPEKRLQLRENLIESREHLLEAVKEAPTASSLPQ
jgi:chromosome condensin MukBEF ATPase and DNA-binding subunit MukB